MEHNGHDKLNGVLRGFLGDAFTLDGKEGGLNMEKLHEAIKKEKPIHEYFAYGSYWGWVKARSLTLYLVKKSLKQA